MSQTAAELHQLFNDVPIGLYRTTPEGEIVLANRAFADMLGFGSVEELMTCNIEHHPQLSRFARENFKAELETCGEVRGRESEANRAEGRSIVIRENVRAVRDQNGRVLYYDGSVEDITDLRQTRDTLKRAEREYQVLFSANPHPMWIFDSRTLEFLAVNDAAVSKYGYSREEFLAKTITEIRPECEARRVTEYVRRAESFATSGPWLHQLKDGQRIEVEITSHPMTFAGRPALFAMARDVTQQLRAERALEEREAYYRALIENVMDIITVLDRDGRILFESPSLYRVLGFRPQDAIGQCVFDFIHPDDLPEVRRILASRVDPLSTATFEVRMLASDGSWKVLEGSVRNLLLDPNIRGFIVNSRDVTARRKEQEELRLNEERLRLAQQAGGIGTWEYDFRRDTGCGSTENAALFGESNFRGPASAEQWLIRVHPEDRLRVGEHLRHSIAGRTNFEDEFRVEWPDGSIHWISCKSEVIPDSAGVPERVVGVNIDISQRKHIEEELAKARDEAVEASRMKSQFLATVSHEIRTPMNAIMGLTGLLSDTQLSDEQRSDLEIIRGSAMHLLELINDILDLSKAEAGKLTCDRIPFDLRATLISVIELVEASAKGKGLKLRLKYPTNIRSMVTGDAGRVRQVVLNFASNAIKFTDRGSVVLRVDAPAGAPSDLLRIAVVDTGQGLSPELEPRLFQRFVQGDTSNNRKYGGTGLGLAISKWLAEAMGGTVGLTNPSGGGAEFWVQLPLPEASTAPPALAIAPPAPSFSTAGGRVLIAEDNSVNQKVLVRLLEKREVRADVAANGMEAVDMWRDFPYDLILMDCRMPEMDGYEATRRIRVHEQGRAHVPIVAVTAHVGEGERQRCLASGMDGYLQKPFQQPDLDKVLQQYLGRAAQTA